MLESGCTCVSQYKKITKQKRQCILNSDDRNYKRVKLSEAQILLGVKGMIQQAVNTDVFGCGAVLHQQYLLRCLNSLQE